jgi:outer membrane protein assembly factor BamD (BamD/ComL family)
MHYRNTIVVVLILLGGCSTKKNTWLSRNYHNLTAHYNVYFNGEESFKAGDQAIRENHQDNYTKVLPMFEASDSEAAAVASGDMDRAIEKGAKLIARHSITAKPQRKSGRQSAAEKAFYSQKEFNKWVDDAMLLIGQAQVYKHEFRQAIRTFDRVIRDFPTKESRYLAMMWKARAFTELKDYGSARTALESYDLDGKAPESLYGAYMEVYANLLLKEERYQESIMALQSAIDGATKNHRKARYCFILGQVKGLTGDENGAALAFEQTLKYNPDFEMAFNARIERASIVYKGAPVEEIRKQIRKLLRDKRNEDFQDQIYYALGKVLQNDGDEKGAIENFITSTEVSVRNDYQKTLSFLALADIYYQKPIYQPAYHYYDSAMAIMSEEFKDYKNLQERTLSLGLLVEELDVIEREDSLMRLADMPEAERLAFLDNIIEQEKEALKEQQKQQEGSYSDDFFFQNQSTQAMSSQAGGKWYFYNITAMGMGKQEFQQRWGKRKLGDEWRRSNKGVIQGEESFDAPGEPGSPGDPGETLDGIDAENGKAGESSEGSEGQAKKKDGLSTRESLLADLPLNEADYEESLEKKYRSMFEAGLIYLERLHDYPRAIEMFEACFSQSHWAYDESLLIALYQAYEKREDIAGMESAKNRMKEHYPESKFIQYLDDPDYLAKIEAQEKVISDAYEVAYNNYLTGRYAEVVEATQVVELKDTVNVYLAKYRLLKALAFARQGQTEQFKVSLEELSQLHPATEEAKLADAFLALLADGRMPVKGTPYQSILAQRQPVQPEAEAGQEEAAEPDMTGYLYDEQEAHSLLVLADADASDVNRLVYNLADFNFSRFLLDDYAIEKQKLPDFTPLALVKGFKNKLEAMDYFYAVREYPTLFVPSGLAPAQFYVISDSNLAFFLSSGQVESYVAFFKAFYLAPVKQDDIPEELRKKESVVDSALKATEKAVNESPLQRPETVDSIQSLPVVATQTEESQRLQNREKEPSVMPEVIVPDSSASVTTLVDSLNEDEPAPGIGQEVISPWIGNWSEQPFVMVVLKKSRMDYRKVENIFRNFTMNSFNGELKVEMDDFTDGYKHISITGFENFEEANNYLNEVNQNPVLLRDIQRREHYVWIMTPKNQSTLLQNGDLKGYEQFFQAESKQ